MRSARPASYHDAEQIPASKHFPTCNCSRSRRSRVGSVGEWSPTDPPPQAQDGRAGWVLKLEMASTTDVRVGVHVCHASPSSLSLAIYIPNMSYTSCLRSIWPADCLAYYSCLFSPPSSQSLIKFVCAPADNCAEREAPASGYQRHKSPSHTILDLALARDSSDSSRLLKVILGVVGLHRSSDSSWPFAV